MNAVVVDVAGWLVVNDVAVQHHLCNNKKVKLTVGFFFSKEQFVSSELHDGLYCNKTCPASHMLPSLYLFVHMWGRVRGRDKGTVPLVKFSLFLSLLRGQQNKLNPEHKCCTLYFFFITSINHEYGVEPEAMRPITGPLTYLVINSFIPAFLLTITSP